MTTRGRAIDVERFREAHVLAPLVAGPHYTREIEDRSRRLRAHMRIAECTVFEAAEALEAREPDEYHRLLLLAAAVEVLAQEGPQ